MYLGQKNKFDSIVPGNLENKFTHIFEPSGPEYDNCC